MGDLYLKWKHSKTRNHTRYLCFRLFTLEPANSHGLPRSRIHLLFMCNGFHKLAWNLSYNPWLARRVWGGHPQEGERETMKFRFPIKASFASPWKIGISFEWDSMARNRLVVTRETYFCLQATRSCREIRGWKFGWPRQRGWRSTETLLSQMARLRTSQGRTRFQNETLYFFIAGQDSFFVRVQRPGRSFKVTSR